MTALISGRHRERNERQGKDWSSEDKVQNTGLVRLQKKLKSLGESGIKVAINNGWTKVEISLPTKSNLK